MIICSVSGIFSVFSVFFLQLLSRVRHLLLLASVLVLGPGRKLMESVETAYGFLFFFPFAKSKGFLGAFLAFCGFCVFQKKGMSMAWLIEEGTLQLDGPESAKRDTHAQIWAQRTTQRHTHYTYAHKCIWASVSDAYLVWLITHIGLSFMVFQSFLAFLVSNSNM